MRLAEGVATQHSTAVRLPASVLQNRSGSGYSGYFERLNEMIIVESLQAITVRGLIQTGWPLPCGPHMIEVYHVPMFFCNQSVVSAELVVDMRIH